MVRSRFFCALALVFGGFALAGCGAGNGGGQSCPDGEPGCRCYGNGTCNPGLTCSSTGICGGSSAGNVPGSGTTSGAGGAPAAAGTSPGAGGAPASGGTGSGGTSGNLVDTCNANLTCWEYGTYNVDPSVELRRIGGNCLLGISSNQSETLEPDGTTDAGFSWYVDADGSLHLCDPNKPGYCWATCRTDSVMNFPCTGTPVDCSMVPASQCSSMVGCDLDSSGNCGGGGTDCETFWKQDICENQGCTWNP